MSEPAFPAARIVAPKVQAHFALHEAEARRRGRTIVAAAPDAETIEALIDAAFWASLRREETYVPKISLAFLEPEAAVHPMRFARPLPLVPSALVKVAPSHKLVRACQCGARCGPSRFSVLSLRSRRPGCWW
jgi:hypothetical protein